MKWWARGMSHMRLLNWLSLYSSSNSSAVVTSHQDSSHDYKGTKCKPHESCMHGQCHIFIMLQPRWLALMNNVPSCQDTSHVVCTICRLQYPRSHPV